MNEKEFEGAKKLIENKDVKKGSYSFIGNSNITYADIKILLDYIKQLEQENQQLKKQYCERTDCSGRIGNSKKIEELEKRLEASERARKEAIDFIKEYEKNQNLLKWNEEDYIDVINEIKKYLDIDKGE